MAQEGSTKRIVTPHDVTNDWLTNAIGHPVSAFNFERVGSGQVAECYRFELKYSTVPADGPASAILKVAAKDQESRHTGVSLGLYQREVLFYQQIAPQLRDHISCISDVYYASYDEEEGTFALLMRDAVDKTSGNDITGATYEQAKACVQALGKIHGHMLRQGVADYNWLKREQPLTQQMLQDCSNKFVARFREKLSVEHHQICAKIVACYDAYKKQQQETCVMGMIHGDYRLDNILFGKDSNDLTVVDWQTVFWGPVIGDLAYFFSAALPVELRRSHMEELLQIYHESLGPGTPLTMEKIREDLRCQAFFGIIMHIVAAVIVAQTERGDVMFATIMARHCDLVKDLDSLKILPKPVQMPIQQPTPEDEHLHERGPEKLFNESYYLDFVDEKQGIAGYVRLGITPNVKEGGWYIGLISRRGKPLISVVDYACPIPDESLQVNGSDYEAGFKAVDPLKTFDLNLSSQKARVHDNPATIFQGDEQGQGTAELSFKLKFHTDGIPYKYRMTTRYEIPCLVDGEVEVAGEKYSLKKAAGQRDHSWGIRNWWNMDWIWTSAHMDDGSHLHAIDLTVQGQGSIGIGYYQTPGKDVMELSDISSKWNINSETNLVDETSMKLTPLGLDEISAEIEPVEHGPMRLVSEEGKVALFDRAWCKWTLGDGRVGYGWVEWNRVQPL